MRHRRRRRKLGRTTAHRQAMVRNLVASLLCTAEGDEEKPWRVTTTVPKAKEARRLAERCVTLGKRAQADPDRRLHALRQALRLLRNRRAVRVLFETIAPLYSDRPGGYTRILRLSSRRLGDGADLCYLELVQEPMAAEGAAAEPVAPRRATTEAGEEEQPPGAPHDEEQGAPDEETQEASAEEREDDAGPADAAEDDEEAPREEDDEDEATTQEHRHGD